MTNKHKRKVKLQILKPRNPLVVEVMRKSVLSKSVSCRWMPVEDIDYLTRNDCKHARLLYLKWLYTYVELNSELPSPANDGWFEYIIRSFYENQK